jgi:RNA polymerase sigma-70 factor (ECF subfamily)
VAPDANARRDETWFDQLYRAHHGAVLAYARRRVDDADDVVAEVFAVAWRSRADVPDEPLPWLLRTAANHVLHSRRSSSRRSRLWSRAVGQSGPAPDHADAVARQHDARATIIQALAGLAPADQEILRLTAWEELTPDEVAVVLSCSPGTARVRLHRARRRLESALAALDPTVRPAPATAHSREETRP